MFILINDIEKKICIFVFSFVGLSGINRAAADIGAVPSSTTAFNLFFCVKENYTPVFWSKLDLGLILDRPVKYIKSDTYNSARQSEILWEINGYFGQKWKFLSKMEILVKNVNFGQKCQFWSKLSILVKNGNFGQKSKISSKI